jgi:hypothetical protein
MASDDEYHWAGDPQGVELGLAATPAAVARGGSVAVKLAVRNRAASSAAIEPEIVLMVRHGERIEEMMGGPRASEALTVEPGELLEMVTWRLHEEQLGSAPGERVMWAVYRPHGGAEVSSGEARIEVVA